MSMKLYYRLPSEGVRVGDCQLKNILNNRFNFPHRLTWKDLDYIRGLCDADIEGAKDLHDAVERNPGLEVYLDE